MKRSVIEIFNNSLSEKTLLSIRQDLVDYNLNELDKITFTRTDKDTEQYEKVKTDLYEMFSLFPDFDWPLVRLCVLIKKWNNFYTEELLQNATKAFSIRQSHEAFVYACRGILANHPSEKRHELLHQIMEETIDDQLKNIGNIFLSICAYDEGDYPAYEKFIGDFRSNKNSDYNPYISIPVSTVFAGKEVPDEPNNFTKVFGSFEKFESDNVDYIISCSSDMIYFELYGEYIVKSFEKSCSDEAVLHISIIDGDENAIASLLKDWEAKRTYFTNHKIELSHNLGPIASIIRFINVSSLMKTYEVPVLVMDLDCVISKPLGKIIEDNSQSNIGSRILKIGVAPWEKYTGGFAIFYPGETTQAVAENIRKISLSQIKDDEDQWWIDQNCFEAGIRYAQKSGLNVKISDLYSSRDDYCFMPVGPKESKIFSLNRELKNTLQ